MDLLIEIVHQVCQIIKEAQLCFFFHLFIYSLVVCEKKLFAFPHKVLFTCYTTSLFSLSELHHLHQYPQLQYLQHSSHYLFQGLGQVQ